MAAINKIGAPVQASPPALPSMTGVPGTLVNYLQTLNIWLTQQLGAKIPAQQAIPQLLLVSPGGNVFALRALDNGNVTIVPVTPGSKPT